MRAENNSIDAEGSENANRGVCAHLDRCSLTLKELISMATTDTTSGRPSYGMYHSDFLQLYVLTALLKPCFHMYKSSVRIYGAFLHLSVVSRLRYEEKYSTRSQRTKVQ